MALSLEQMNLLVWRYLRENGFQHSAFLFESESLIDAANMASSHIPPETLVALLQKSLRYMKMERIINRARKDPSLPYAQHIEKLEARFAEQIPEPEEGTPPSTTSEPIQLSPAVAAVLASHRSVVYCCRWSPSGRELATASSDGTVIVWNMVDGVATNQVVIGVASDSPFSERDVTCIDWDKSGGLLASGSLDSSVKVSNKEGRNLAALTGHSHNVFVLKFNPAGELIVSGGADHLIFVWMVSNFQKLGRFDFHTDTVLDIAWKDVQTFATASADFNIGICSISGAYSVLPGHKDHVNAIAYNFTGTILASGSSDCTVRLWRDLNEVTILRGHESGVSSIEWLRGSDTTLVSGSMDGSLRVWDANQSGCLRVIKCHDEDIFSISVSPSLDCIASGSKDLTVVITRIEDGSRIAAFSGNSEVYDVRWDPSGRYIAATFEDSTVAVIPIHQYLR
jgi:transducin (beta)-like 1